MQDLAALPRPPHGRLFSRAGRAGRAPSPRCSSPSTLSTPMRRPGQHCDQSFVWGCSVLTERFEFCRQWAVGDGALFPATAHLPPRPPSVPWPRVSCSVCPVVVCLQAVASLVGRCELMAALFFLLTLLCFAECVPRAILRFVECPHVRATAVIHTQCDIHTVWRSHSMAIAKDLWLCPPHTSRQHAVLLFRALGALRGTRAKAKPLARVVSDLRTAGSWLGTRACRRSREQPRATDATRARRLVLAPAARARSTSPCVVCALLSLRAPAMFPPGRRTRHEHARARFVALRLTSRRHFCALVFCHGTSEYGTRTSLCRNAVNPCKSQPT